MIAWRLPDSHVAFFLCAVGRDWSNLCSPNLVRAAESHAAAMFSISLALELISSSVKVLQQACVRLVLRNIQLPQ